MKIIIKILFILVAAIIIVNMSLNMNNSEENKISKKDLYGAVKPEKYLTGRYVPKSHKSFVNLKNYKILTNGREHYLRKETAIALKNMITAFNKEYPKIKIKVISSTRNFYHQKSIWNAKWTGKRLVSGEKLNKTTRDPIKRALKILKYSSMPGTSRHHWGTDFDINSLNNNYFESGEGKIIFSWLRKNAAKYGFTQPYNENRKSGYEEERWHWSYIPLAKKYYYDWINYFDNDLSIISKEGLFGGSSNISHLAPIYVKGINSDCR